MDRVRLHKHLLLSPVIALALLLAMAGIALAHPAQPGQPAHAKVLSAIPAIGSTIAQAPTTVTVFTAENMNPDPDKSNLFVYSPGGDLISQSNAKVSLNNPKEMSVTIKPTGNGVYIVRWITVSALDGDPDQGAFFFKVQAGAAATPTPVPTTSTSNSGSTPPATTTTGTGGTPVWATIVIGIVALLLGLAAGFGASRSMFARPSISTMRRSVAAQREEESEPSKRP